MWQVEMSLGGSFLSLLIVTLTQRRVSSRAGGALIKNHCNIKQKRDSWPARPPPKWDRKAGWRELHLRGFSPYFAITETVRILYLMYKFRMTVCLLPWQAVIKLTVYLILMASSRQGYVVFNSDNSSCLMTLSPTRIKGNMLKETGVG